MADEETVKDAAPQAPAAPPAESSGPAAASAPEAKPEAKPEPKPEAKPEAKPEDKTPERSEAAAIMAGDEAPAPVVAPKGRRAVRVPPVGIVHVRATFNNTVVTITDMRGAVVSWCSSGRAGFKGSRKSTAFAATMVAQDASRQAAAKGMHEVEIRVQGAGSGRESAIRAVQSSGLTISAIKDVTPIPHNGCRQRKRRRV